MHRSLTQLFALRYYQNSLVHGGFGELLFRWTVGSEARFDPFCENEALGRTKEGDHAI
jgi:hypothetical protein